MTSGCLILPLATSAGTSASGTRRVSMSSPLSHSTGCLSAQFSMSTVWQVLLMMAGFAKTSPSTRACSPSKPVSSRSSRTPVCRGEASERSMMPPGISSSTVFVPWRYCSTITSSCCGVMASTFTQSTQSMMKKSCFAPVRGESFSSVRTVKMRKSPTEREPSFCQGRIMVWMRSEPGAGLPTLAAST